MPLTLISRPYDITKNLVSNYSNLVYRAAHPSKSCNLRVAYPVSMGLSLRNQEVAYDDPDRNDDYD